PLRTASPTPTQRQAGQGGWEAWRCWEAGAPARREKRRTDLETGDRGQIYRHVQESVDRPYPSEERSQAQAGHLGRETLSQAKSKGQNGEGEGAGGTQHGLSIGRGPRKESCSQMPAGEFWDTRVSPKPGRGLHSE
ncbi:hypothetical protein H1C71_040235, partial [Ictidomys tridecemlineatus]